MKATYLICPVLMLVFWAGCVTPQARLNQSQPTLPPGHHAQSFERMVTKTVSCRYLVFLPEGYGQKQQHWPLIMFLHGASESGSDLEKVKTHGPPKIAEKQKDFPFIIVSPQCPQGEWWTHKIDLMINLLDEVAERYDVDKERVYLTGINMGGHGTWYLAWEYPERFAAIAPICGWGSLGKACNLKNVPVWAFHGAKDKAVPVARSAEMVNAVKACGGDAKLTVYPDTGHDCWTVTYDNKELYDWFLEHRKNKRIDK